MIWNDARRALSQIRPTGRGVDAEYAYDYAESLGIPYHRRKKPGPQDDMPQPESRLGRLLSQKTRDEWMAAARVTHYKLKQLALEDHGRALIESAAKAHAMFLGLLVIWVWSM